MRLQDGTEVTVRRYQEADVEKIVGVGSISSFWGSPTESILLTIFVKPELHGLGIGRFIIQTLEQDTFSYGQTELKYRLR